MNNIFMVRLWTSNGCAGTAVFSTLEGANKLVTRLNEHNKFIVNNMETLCAHEFEYIDQETGERFLFCYGSGWIDVKVEKMTLHQ